MAISKPYTSDSFDAETKAKFDEGWERVFGKKKVKKSTKPE